MNRKQHWVYLAAVLLVLLAVGCKRRENENVNTTTGETMTTGSAVTTNTSGTGYPTSDTGANLSTMATTDTGATVGTSGTTATTGTSGTTGTHGQSEHKSGAPAAKKKGT